MKLRDKEFSNFNYIKDLKFHVTKILQGKYVTGNWEKVIAIHISQRSNILYEHEYFTAPPHSA